MADSEIMLTRGITTRWPFAATMADAFGNPIPIPLNASGLRLVFIAIGTPDDIDANAFIVKDNYLYMGITLTDAPNGIGYIDFEPADTTGPIWPYYPALLYWGFKAITTGLDEIPIDGGLMVIDQFGVKRITYS